MNLHLVEGVDVPYGSVQESLAIHVWRKRQRIELYRTIAVCTAAVNPEKAQGALQKLIEEMFPEVGKDREKAVERAMAIMEKESEKTYRVAAADGAMKKTPFGGIRRILDSRNRRRPR